jgi:two-component system, sensor histidine kinase YesM
MRHSPPREETQAAGGPRKRLYYLLRKTRIRNRLLASFLILSIFPVLFVGIISFVRTYEDMERKAVDYSRNISYQIVGNIGYLFDNYIDKFERVALNSTILADIYNYDQLKEYRQIEVENRVRYTIASIVGIGEGIDSMELRIPGGERFYYSYPISHEEIARSALLSEAGENEGITWNVTQKEVDSDREVYIILAKKMLIQFEEEVTGWALMSIKREYLDQVSRNNNRDWDSYTVITDAEGMIISHPDQQMILTPFDRQITARIAALEQKHSSSEEQNNLFRISNENGDLLVSYAILQRNGWRVINIVPYGTLMKSTMDNGFITMLTILLCIIVAVIISLMVTRSISLPVEHLITNMEMAGSGDLDIRIDENWAEVRDEFSTLSQGFNEMVFRLKKLIDDVYRAQLKEKELEFLKKEAELNALQQQINPHFLYNTLEAIFWTAQLKGEEEISEMVSALGDFFRTSINKGIEYISIADEVKNVKTYVYLQKIRFGSRFDVEWDISGEILQYKTIKLILQPIIENAIVHGIEGMESGGLIRISGRREGRRIIFAVSDNGKGMGAEEISRLELFINSTEKDTGRSIGVKNVNQRIKLYFGEEYGVTFASAERRGTTVKIEVPVFESELHTDYPLGNYSAR